jgi:hypothetical protein
LGEGSLAVGRQAFSLFDQLPAQVARDFLVELQLRGLADAFQRDYEKLHLAKTR